MHNTYHHAGKVILKTSEVTSSLGDEAQEHQSAGHSHASQSELSVHQSDLQGKVTPSISICDILAVAIGMTLKKCWSRHAGFSTQEAGEESCMIEQFRKTLHFILDK